MATFTPLTVSFNYEPQTLQEMMIPLNLYKQEYDKRIADIDAKEQGLATFSPYINDDSPEAKAMYDDLANKIEQNSQYIGTPGYLLNEVPIRNLKKTYAKTISDLTSAAKNFETYRNRIIEEKSKHPGLVYNSVDKDGNIRDSMSIDNFIKGRNMRLVSVDTDDIIKKAAAQAASISKRLASTFGSGAEVKNNGNIITIQNNESGATVDMKLGWFTDPDKYKSEIDDFLAKHKGEQYQKLFDADILGTRQNLLDSTSYNELSEENKAKVDSAYEYGFNSGLGPYQKNYQKHITQPSQGGGGGGGIATPSPSSDGNTQHGRVYSKDIEEDWKNDFVVVDGKVRTSNSVNSTDAIRATDKYRQSISQEDIDKAVTELLNDNHKTKELFINTLSQDEDFKATELGKKLTPEIEKIKSEYDKKIETARTANNGEPDSKYISDLTVEFNDAVASKIRESFVNASNEDRSEIIDYILADSIGLGSDYSKEKRLIANIKKQTKHLPNLAYNPETGAVGMSPNAGTPEGDLDRINAYKHLLQLQSKEQDTTISYDDDYKRETKKEIADLVLSLTNSSMMRKWVEDNHHILGHNDSVRNGGGRRNGVFEYDAEGNSYGVNPETLDSINEALRDGDINIRFSKKEGVIVDVIAKGDRKAGTYIINGEDSNLTKKVNRAVTLASVMDDWGSKSWEKSVEVDRSAVNEIINLGSQMNAVEEQMMKQISDYMSAKNAGLPTAAYQAEYEKLKKQYEDLAKDNRSKIEALNPVPVKSAEARIARIRLSDGSDCLQLMISPTGNIIASSSYRRALENPGDESAKIWRRITGDTFHELMKNKMNNGKQ